MGGPNHLKGLGAVAAAVAGAGHAQGGEAVVAADLDLAPGLQGREGESDRGLGTGEAGAGQGEEERRGQGQGLGGGTSQKAGVGAGAPRRRDQEAGVRKRKSQGINQWRRRAGTSPSLGSPLERNQNRARSFLIG